MPHTLKTKVHNSRSLVSCSGVRFPTVPGGVTVVVVMVSGVSLEEEGWEESREDGDSGEVGESDLPGVPFPGLKYLSLIQTPPPNTRSVNVTVHQDKAFLGSLAGEDGDVETGRGWMGMGMGGCGLDEVSQREPRG